MRKLSSLTRRVQGCNGQSSCCYSTIVGKQLGTSNCTTKLLLAGGCMVPQSMCLICVRANMYVTFVTPRTWRMHHEFSCFFVGYFYCV